MKGLEARALVPGLCLMPTIWVFLVVLQSQGSFTPAWAFALATFLIVGVDLPHQVWTALRAKRLLIEGRLSSKEMSSVVVLWLAGGLACAFASPTLAFSLLAYFTIHHNVRQQLGLLARFRSGIPWIERTSEWCLWFAMWLGVVYWHISPIAPGFISPGDLFTFPNALNREGVRTAACAFGALALALEGFSALQRRNRGSISHARVLVTLSSILPWVLAITVYEDRLLFGIANVLGHSIPYFALIENSGDRISSAPGLVSLFLYAAAMFAAYGYLVMPVRSDSLAPEAIVRVVACLVLLLPLVHYFADAVLWRSWRESRA
jgi:hypothetical protein